MEVDHEPSRHPGVIGPPVPIEGVAYILSGWSGSGSLYQTLGSIRDVEGIERTWTDRDLRNRANRILLEHLRADLAYWPATLDGWLPYLPITSRAQTFVSRVPQGQTDWRETSRRFGWPPRSYVSRLREREIADVTVTTLAWTVAELVSIVEQARTAGALGEVDPGLDDPLRAAKEALALTNVPEELPRPDRLDLESLLSSGAPWTAVEPVAAKIVRAETDLNWFALQLLAPDPEFRWRLFHLAVLGHVLQALRTEGASINWRAPMGSGVEGPNFVGELPNGTTVDIWFETAGARAYYGCGESTYHQVVGPVRSSDTAIGADVGLFIPDSGRALLLESKYSWSGSYVGRDGYHQAAGYALNEYDLWSHLGSYVVGPDEIISSRSISEIHLLDSTISLGVTNVASLEGLISDFLQ